MSPAACVQSRVVCEESIPAELPRRENIAGVAGDAAHRDDDDRLEGARAGAGGDHHAEEADPNRDHPLPADVFAEQRSGQ